VNPISPRLALGRDARGSDGGYVLSGFFGDGARFASAECRQVDEIGSDAEGEGAGVDEIGDVFQRHTAGGDQLDLRQRRFDRFQISRDAERIRGEDFHGIRAGFPRSRSRLESMRPSMATLAEVERVMKGGTAWRPHPLEIRFAPPNAGRPAPSGVSFCAKPSH
jgi:hypothetical protein